MGAVDPVRRNHTLESYFAWQAWYNSAMADMPDKLTDVTNLVGEAIETLDLILNKDDSMLVLAGFTLRREQVVLNSASQYKDDAFLGISLRIAPEARDFCNHMYGSNGRCIITFNKALQNITLTTCDEIDGVSCKKIMNDTFAGCSSGSVTKAYSPVGRAMTLADAERLYKVVQHALVQSKLPMMEVA